jgi:hypothetical protein
MPRPIVSWLCWIGMAIRCRPNLRWMLRWRERGVDECYSTIPRIVRWSMSCINDTERSIASVFICCVMIRSSRGLHNFMAPKRQLVGVQSEKVWQHRRWSVIVCQICWADHCACWFTNLLSHYYAMHCFHLQKLDADSPDALFTRQKTLPLPKQGLLRLSACIALITSNRSSPAAPPD